MAVELSRQTPSSPAGGRTIGAGRGASRQITFGQELEHFTSGATLGQGCRAATPASVLRANNGSGHLSLDYLVGAGDERRRHGEADFVCRFQIDDELEPGRLLDRQLGRFRSLQDLCDITGCNRHHFGLMGTVGDETARVDAFAEGMEDRQPLSARKLGQEFCVKHRALLCEHNEAIRPISRKGGKSAFDVLRREELNSLRIKTQLLREFDRAGRLRRLADVLRVEKDHDARGGRQKLAEDPHALRA